MTNWKELVEELNKLVKLDSGIIACKRMAKKDGYMDIPGIEKPHKGFLYCQLPYLVRKQGKTIGVTKEDFEAYADKTQLKYRCVRIQGLAPADEKELDSEAKGFAGFWFKDYDTAMEQMKIYPAPTPIEALVMSPLEEEKFEPDYIMIYADGEQMTFILNGLQYHKYELIESCFIGEGSCADALPRSAATKKPSLSLPCLGERNFGLAGKEELILTIPPDRLERIVEGLKALKENGLAYPATPLEPAVNAGEMLQQLYPLQDS